jgi:hypothetical protein
MGAKVKLGERNFIVKWGRRELCCVESYESVLRGVST